MRMLLFAIECWAVVNLFILTFGFLLFGLLMDGPPWWRTPFHRDRVRDALRQALAALDREEPAL